MIKHPRDALGHVMMLSQRYEQRLLLTTFTCITVEIEVDAPEVLVCVRPRVLKVKVCSSQTGSNCVQQQSQQLRFM